GYMPVPGRARKVEIRLAQIKVPGKNGPVFAPTRRGSRRSVRKTRSLAGFSRRKAMSAVALTVNGKAVTGDVDPRTLLVQFLRENLRLTGTHVGCDTSQCGACVAHVDGKAVKACTVFVWQIEGANVTTSERLA